MTQNADFIPTKAFTVAIANMNLTVMTALAEGEQNAGPNKKLVLLTGAILMMFEDEVQGLLSMHDDYNELSEAEVMSIINSGDLSKYTLLLATRAIFLGNTSLSRIYKLCADFAATNTPAYFRGDEHKTWVTDNGVNFVKELLPLIQTAGYESNQEYMRDFYVEHVAQGFSRAVRDYINGFVR